MSRLIVLLAEGFGAGRSPVAPGTFGTLVGFGWIFLLLLPRSLALYAAGTVAGILAALWIGARAEAILQKKDPGSIVIDEIVALPLAFLPVIWTVSNRSAKEIFAAAWMELILCFCFFRLFDVWKPWIIRRSQAWPGGLVVDDLLAALATAGVLLAWRLMVRGN